MKRQTLTFQTVDYVSGLIRKGRLKPGDRLPTEMELTETLGVSRTCIREAMKCLEYLGLVRIRPRVGATVLDPSPHRLRHAELFSVAAPDDEAAVLMEFRHLVETGIASLAAHKAGPPDIAQMQRVLDRFESELRGDRVDCLADISFHAALAAACQNPLVEKIWQMLATRLSEVLDRTAAVLPASAAQTLRDHRRIFKAIKERKPAAARAAMRVHLENAERVWRVALSARQRRPAAAGTRPGSSTSKAVNPTSWARV
jgi:GntR family transcriptional repressor for pyruvate dehydrogenase complex